MISMNENRNSKKRWTEKELGSQVGKNVIITGTGGLGYEAAISLAGAGANVIIAGRNANKGAKAVQAIKNEYPHATIDRTKNHSVDTCGQTMLNSFLVTDSSTNFYK